MKMNIRLSRYFFILVLVLTISTTLSAQNFYRHRDYYHYYPDYRSYGYFGPGIFNYNYGYLPVRSSFPYYAPYFGIRMDVLPFGYRTIFVGADPFYYYDGTYYTHRNNYYEATTAPIGAKLPELPSGSKAVVIDGMKYYEHRGTYYKEEISGDNHLLYEVVGTNGVLNTPQAPIDNNDVGTRVDNLPANTRTVIINKQKYYVAPTGIYYQEIIDGNRVYYQVVGN